MSGGGSQTSTTVNQADPRIWDAVNRNVSRATEIADRPFEAYGGQMVAGLSPGYNEAIARAPGINNAGYGSLLQAQGGAQSLLNTQNPYTDQVINASLGDIERQRQMQQQTDADAAIGARAFGGSREGVQRALTNDAYDRNALNTVAGLRSAGFDKSLAATAQGAGLLSQLGGQQQQMAMNGQNALLQAGGLQQGNQQANLDALFSEFMRQQNHGYQGQSLINQSLGLLPQGGTTTSTQPKQSELGGIGSLLGGAASIAGLFSDERLKSDIETVGYDESGRRWTTWRYNWEDPRIRHFGVIAQEVAKAEPDAVSVHESGYLVVDYSKLTRH